ncbi:replication initiator protein A [Propionivibrio sp.]|jgi:plasmid replication initiation protein|uniref:replication initiator protein A n=1 Tax=Betaproteobacteria TaxID=28216 RepID=UPI001B7767A9|nr:replication initiator protein A [Propionivibrio sp.]MBK6559933.1 replication initiator protein A [Comamonadaceae bacterium]MBK8362062.1 replication initiator protein A [Comamonadaceae bacterium]MBK8744096.1 replication initiator protein A [Propionivibrio sp.]MBP8135443.1 replication initiator protein A [Rhodoferax sp.]
MTDNKCNSSTSKRLDELLEMAKNRGNVEEVKANKLPAALVPVRHPQKDFFIADILDVSIKDDLASMEHPLFALKAGDMRVKTYERNGNSVTVQPGHGGCATIHDKDIWIYCISQMVEAMNRGREVNKTVRFTAYDFLTATNRDTSGRAYERMAEAMARLRNTGIETNIETAGQRERRGFGLVESWRVVEKTSGGRMVAVEVTFPDWLIRSVTAKHVLTLSPDYFRIRKPINRRVYELARKHCGNQKQWQCSVETLHEKSGSTDTIRKLRAVLKSLADVDDLPDYSVTIDPTTDVVTFSKR